MKLKLDFVRKIQKSNLEGYAQVCIANKELSGLTGKKVLIKGEVIVTEV